MPLFTLNQIEAKSNQFLLDLYEYRGHMIEAEKLKPSDKNAASALYLRAIFYYQSAIEKAIKKATKKAVKPQQIEEKKEYVRWLHGAYTTHTIDGVFFLITNQLDEMAQPEAAARIFNHGNILRNQLFKIIQQEENKLLSDPDLAIPMKIIALDHTAGLCKKRKSKVPLILHYAEIFRELLRKIIGSNLYFWVSKPRNITWLNEHYQMVDSLLDGLPKTDPTLTATIADSLREVRDTYQKYKDLAINYENSSEQDMEQIDKEIELIFEWKGKNILNKFASYTTSTITAARARFRAAVQNVGWLWKSLYFLQSLALIATYPLALPSIYIWNGRNGVSSLHSTIGSGLKSVGSFINKHRWLSAGIALTSALSVAFPFILPLAGFTAAAAIGSTAAPLIANVTLDALGISYAVDDEFQLIDIAHESELAHHEQKIEEKKAEIAQVISLAKRDNTKAVSNEDVWRKLAKEFYQPKSHHSNNAAFNEMESKTESLEDSDNSEEYFERIIDINTGETIEVRSFKHFLDNPRRNQESVAQNERPSIKIPVKDTNNSGSSQREHTLATFRDFIKNDKLLTTAVTYNCTDIIKDHIRYKPAGYYEQHINAKALLFNRVALSSATEELFGALLDKIITDDEFSRLKGPSGESLLYITLKAKDYPSLRDKMAKAITSVIDNNSSFYNLNADHKNDFFDLATDPIVSTQVLSSLMAKISSQSIQDLLTSGQGEDWLRWIFKIASSSLKQDKIEDVALVIFNKYSAFKILAPNLLKILFEITALSGYAQKIVMRALIRHLEQSLNFSLFTHLNGVTWAGLLAKACEHAELKERTLTIIRRITKLDLSMHQKRTQLVNCMFKFLAPNYVSEEILSIILERIITSAEFCALKNGDEQTWRGCLAKVPHYPTLKDRHSIAIDKLLAQDQNSFSHGNIQDIFDLILSPHLQEHQLEYILRCISFSDQYAKQRNKDGESWIYCLAKATKFSTLETRVQKAVERLMQLGVSPYERSTLSHATVFKVLSHKDSYNIMELIRPQSIYSEFLDCEEQINKLRNFCKSIKANPTRDIHLLILTGPPGTGKTALSYRITKEEGFTSHEFKAAEEDQFVNQVEFNLQNTFMGLKQNGNHCLILDEIQKHTRKVKQGTEADAGDFDQRVITDILQTELTHLKGYQSLVIGTTNDPSIIDNAIKNKAQFIHFTLPKLNIRLKYIDDKLRLVKLEDNSLPLRIADATAGWSFRALGGYLTEMCENLTALPLTNKTAVASFEQHRDNMIAEYKNYGLTVVPPSLKLNDNNNSSEEMIEVSQYIMKRFETVNTLLAEPQSFDRNLIKKQLNYLLAGPPGVGKTLFARETANNNNAMFLALDAQSYDPETLRYALDQTKSFERVVMFFDEFHVLFSDKKLTAMLLTALDGFNKNNNVLVALAATNHADEMPNELKVRFQRINFDLPDLSQRRALFLHLLSKLKNIRDFHKDLLNPKNLDIFALATRSLPHRSIERVINDALITLTVQSCKNKTKRFFFTADFILNSIEDELRLEGLSTKIIEIERPNCVIPREPASLSFSTHRFQSSSTQNSSNPSTPIEDEEFDEENKYDFDFR